MLQQELARRLPASPPLSVSVLRELILAVFGFHVIYHYRTAFHRRMLYGAVWVKKSLNEPW